MIRFRRKAEIGIGAGGVRVIQWVGRRAGAYELQWKHCREWQGEASVIGRFQASLIEKADPINVGYAKQTLFWSVSLKCALRETGAIRENQMGKDEHSRFR